VMKLGGKAGFYLAAGMQVPEGVRDQVKAAHVRLQSRGTYTIIPAASLPE